MKNSTVTAMYFSPTGTTQTVVSAIARTISEKTLGKTQLAANDFTLPQGRKESAVFTEQDIVVLGVPVYAGRVPNVLLPYLNSLAGGGAKAVAIVVYGNRNYDDALIELGDILQARGFTAVAAGAFIGEHSFSQTLAQARPDQNDLALAIEFASQAASKIRNQTQPASVVVTGSRPYRPYYMPRNEKNESVDFRRIKPKTNADCIDCKLCAEVCPMGSIDYNDVSQVVGMCIKCGACIKKCPVQAKFYDDENYVRHKRELEVDCARRREPECFIEAGCKV